jgi:hypothetical protein
MTTVATLLSPHLDEATRAFAASVGQDNAVLQLPVLTRGMVSEKLSSSLQHLSAISIGGVLMQALPTCVSLYRAVEKSLSSGERQTAHVQGFTVPVDYEPELEIVVNGKKIASLRLRLRVGLELIGMTATVTAGRLVGLVADVFWVQIGLGAGPVTVPVVRAPLNASAEISLPPEGVPLSRGTARV